MKKFFGIRRHNKKDNHQFLRSSFVISMQIVHSFYWHNQSKYDAFFDVVVCPWVGFRIEDFWASEHILNTKQKGVTFSRYSTFVRNYHPSM